MIFGSSKIKVFKTEYVSGETNCQVFYLQSYKVPTFETILKSQ